MIAALSDGKYASLDDALSAVAMKEEYLPMPTMELEEKYRKFCVLYRAALEIN